MLEEFLSLEGKVFNRSPGEVRKRNCGKEAHTGTTQSTVGVCWGVAVGPFPPPSVEQGLLAEQVVPSTTTPRATSQEARPGCS